MTMIITQTERIEHLKRFYPELPDDLHIKGDLNLSWNDDLLYLPDGLTVDGWVDLEGCTSLVELPADFHVGYALWIGGCLKLTGLPSGLVVKDVMYTAGRVFDIPSDAQIFEIDPY